MRKNKNMKLGEHGRDIFSELKVRNEKDYNHIAMYAYMKFSIYKVLTFFKQ